MFDKFEWIANRYEELSEAIVQPEIIADTAKYQACLKERAALELQVEAWRRYQALLHSIAQDAPWFLEPGGTLLMEVGYGQAEHVMALCKAAGLTPIAIHEDYQHIPRIVEARL